MKKILLAILAIVTIYGVWNVATYAYFDDVDAVKDNSITVGTWMSVDSSSAMLAGNGWANLHGIFLIPGESGSDNVIDKISISWTGGEGKVTEIRIGGKTFWSGIGASGQELIGDNGYIVDKKTVNEYGFDSDMHGKTFTIDFTMDDEQIISDTFTPKWRDEKPEGWKSSSSSDSNSNGDTQIVTGGNTETLTTN